MAEIYNIKKGSKNLGLFYEGLWESNESYRGALAHSFATNVLQILITEIHAFMMNSGENVPSDPFAFINFYEDNEPFRSWMENQLSSQLSRINFLEGDVIVNFYTSGEINNPDIFIYRDRSVVRDIKKNNTPVYKVVKDGKTIFHKQLCDGYTEVFKPVVVGTPTATSMRWDLTNVDKQLPVDIYFKLTESNTMPTNINEYVKVSSLVVPGKRITHTSTGLLGDKQYFGWIALKHNTLDIQPILLSKRDVSSTREGGLEIGVITTNVNEASITVKNESAVYTYQLWAAIGLASGPMPPLVFYNMSLGPGDTKKIIKTGLIANTSYTVYIRGKTDISGTDKYWPSIGQKSEPFATGYSDNTKWLPLGYTPSRWDEETGKETASPSIDPPDTLTVAAWMEDWFPYRRYKQGYIIRLYYIYGYFLVDGEPKPLAKTYYFQAE